MKTRQIKLSFANTVEQFDTGIHSTSLFAPEPVIVLNVLSNLRSHAYGWWKEKWRTVRLSSD